MRYVVAMIAGLVTAALAARFVAIGFAPWFARQFSYDSPDGSANVEQFAFLAVLAGGLLLGWCVGWLVAYPLRQRSGPS